MVKKAVIICGGMATRFLPISKSIPKEMMPVLNKPILQILVEDLHKSGIEDILIIVGRNKECIERHFTKNVELDDTLIRDNKKELLKLANEHNCFIHYLVQDAPLGTGHCVDLAKTFTGNDPFVLLYGDELMLCENKSSIQQLIETYEKYGKSVISTQTCPRSEVYKYGVIDGSVIEDGVMQVNKIVEKPKVEEAPSNVCYLGTGVLTCDIYPKLATIPNVGKEIPITDAYNMLALDGKLISKNVEGKRLDMGNPFGFLIANIEYTLTTEYKDQLKEYLKDLVNKL